ncbi:MAG: ABC transporter permease [Marinilabiliaceae bacterium]
MNISFFIAKRLMNGDSEERRLSGPAVKVATAAIALGMVVMIVSLAVGLGFKQQIRDKIVGFGTHIQITGLNLNSSFETPPVSRDSVLTDSIRHVAGVRSVQPYITKPGIIKTDDAFQGVALKGVDASYDWDFLRSCLVGGDVVATPDSAKGDGILMSHALASLLKLDVGSAVRMFFVQDGKVRARRFTLCGVFDSHFEEFDKSMAFVDMRHLAQLNGWDDSQISGYEVLLNDFDRMDDVADDIANLVVGHEGDGDDMLRVRNIRDLQPQIFGWLDLLDQNILVILVLVIAVAGLNMVSGLLILILEHTNAIGVLKALGATNGMLRKVFITMALRIVGIGLLAGDVIGVGLCALQSATGVVGLDPDNYYLDTVPILLSAAHLVLLNIGVGVMCLLLMLGPSGLVASISPAKSIRFN